MNRPVIIDSTQTEDAFKAVLNVNPHDFTELVESQPEFTHKMGHRGFTEAKLNCDCGVLNVVLTPSTEADAEPSRSFDDYFSPIDEEQQSEQIPQYTHVCFLDRDVYPNDRTIQDAQSAGLVYLATLAQQLEN